MRGKKVNIWAIGGLAALINLIFVQGSIKRMLITLLITCVVVVIAIAFQKKSKNGKGDADEK